MKDCEIRCRSVVDSQFVLMPHSGSQVLAGSTEADVNRACPQIDSSLKEVDLAVDEGHEDKKRGFKWFIRR